MLVLMGWLGQIENMVKFLFCIVILVCWSTITILATDYFREKIEDKRIKEKLRKMYEEGK